QPHVPSSSHRPPVAAPHAAPADPLREASPWRLVGDRERGRRALAPPQGSALVTCRNEDRPGFLPERLGQGCRPSRVHVEVHAELLERGDPLTAPVAGRHVEAAQRGGPELEPCRAYADGGPRSERGHARQLEYER